MDIGAIFLLLALLILVVLFVARPFMEHPSRGVTAEAHELSSLRAERDRLLNDLQELDFDQALGKIPVGDYPKMRADLLKRGAAVLGQLDALIPSPSPLGRGEWGEGDHAEDRLEAAIAARRAGTALASASTDADKDEEIEAAIAARRAARKDKTAGFCPKCGKPVLQSDRFCFYCGKPLK